MSEHAREPVKISIVIPTYQAGETLAGALASITEQTFQNYEVLIIDGGSTDGTATIGTEFDQRFEQIHYFSEPDEGVFDAMNTGIQKASGQWLYFLGADDRLFSNDTLQLMADSLAADWQVVYGNVVSTRWNGVYGGEFDGERILNANICHQAIFCHRSVFDRLGRFNLKYRFAGDWEFNFRWMLSPEIRKRHVDQVIAVYADGGVSSQNRDLCFEEDRMLLYVQHGRNSLSFQTRLTIVAKEMERAIRKLSLSLFFRAPFTLLRSLASK